jgi:hypothetical protein
MRCSWSLTAGFTVVTLTFHLHTHDEVAHENAQRPDNSLVTVVYLTCQTPEIC